MPTSVILGTSSGPYLAAGVTDPSTGPKELRFGLGFGDDGVDGRLADARLRARTWTREHGEDLPEITSWAWPGVASRT